MSTAVDSSPPRPPTDPIYEDGWSFQPSERSAFGPIVSEFEIEDALADCVRRWQRDYLAEIARQRALDPELLPPFRSIVASGDIEKMSEDQTPTLVVASPGVQAGGTPRGIQERGTGAIGARVQLDLASFVAARGNRQALRLARLYSAAVTALILQQALEPTSAITIVRVEWTGRRYDRLDSDADRTMARGVVSFVVDTANVVNWQAGPREPVLSPTELTDPPEPMEFPEIVTKQVTVTKKED